MNSRASPAPGHLAENQEEAASSSPPVNLKEEISPLLLREDCLLEVTQAEGTAAHEGTREVTPAPGSMPLGCIANSKDAWFPKGTDVDSLGFAFTSE